MINLEVEIELCSATLLGSGEGWGSIVDTDTIFDKYGIPYLPGRRVKGLLRESAEEVLEMFDEAGINSVTRDSMKKLFGTPGNMLVPNCRVNNFYLRDYKILKQWIKWGATKYSIFFSKDIIENVFTEIRQQTRVDKNGVAKENSLRTKRVLKKGLVFKGNVSIEDDKGFLKLFVFSCANLRRIGSDRNRGLGKVNCTVRKDGNILAKEFLEELKDGGAI